MKELGGSLNVIQSNTFILQKKNQVMLLTKG